MIEPLLAHCQHTVVQHGGILMTLLVAGLVGSLTHCAGMCGPFVIAQTTARLKDTPVSGMNEWRRLQGAALMPYHLGRITTYIALGVLVSVLTQGVVMTTGFKVLNGILLLMAGAMFLSAACLNIKMTGWKFKVPFLERIQSFFSDRAKKFLFHPTGIRGYIAGILLGFLPCGLLYSALLIASASSPGVAAVGMALFGLGTIPVLFIVSYGICSVGRKSSPKIELVGRIFMLANGLLLIVLAGQKFLG
jgi:hypothetical protein